MQMKNQNQSSGLLNNGSGRPAAWVGLGPFEVVRLMTASEEGWRRKRQKKVPVAEQPEPFTPGLTKARVREHAERLLEERLLDHYPLTLEDWILAEGDLIGESKHDLS